MVVNWSGKQPDREGYWLILVHFTESDEREPLLIDVYENEDVPGSFIAYHKAFNSAAYSVDDLFSDRLEPTIDQGAKPTIYDNQLYTIKCATQPIQFENVDWDYKYKLGES